jgi:cephalosporin hydroxylase
MNPIEKFEQEKNERVVSYQNDKEFNKLGQEWLRESMSKNYVYNFSWMGRPIIQQPQDMVAMQEIIWQVKPDLIIETGIAHGGSIIYYASLLELIGKGEVVGIDIEIRAHNRAEIEKHPMSKRIKMIEGSSIDDSTIAKLKELMKGKEKIMICLDSYHTHEHVLKELEIYSKFVSKDSYLVVFDSFVEDMPKNFYPNRPWTVGDNPKTAIWEFVKKNKDFVIDKSIQDKIIVTCSPDGYLKKIN